MMRKIFMIKKKKKRRGELVNLMIKTVQKDTSKKM